jgi:hypothetical protein
VDPFIALFQRGGRYADRLYKLLEKLHIFNQITVDVAERLRAGGFFQWGDIRVPLVWPDIRADLPDHDEPLLADQTDVPLPVHQDFGSTKCHRAWRLWIPLRPSNVHTGSMRVYIGTHKKGVLPHNLDNPLRPFIEPHHYAGYEPLVLDLPAGDGVLLDPLVLHASVPNRSDRVKFTLMIQVQDLASMSDPDDDKDPLAIFEVTDRLRARARIEHDPRVSTAG